MTVISLIGLCAELLTSITQTLSDSTSQSQYGLSDSEHNLNY